MRIIPTAPIASQTLQVVLGQQSCRINVKQRSSGLYLDLYFAGERQPVLGGVICQNLNRLVIDTYLRFVGDLLWLDNQGNEDPYYTGLGSRWSLIYLEEADL